MNLKLSDWNESCRYAKEVCDKLNSKGCNVKIKPYTMYDGRKGIYFITLDNMNEPFNLYATGIHTNINDMKKAIDDMALRITKAYS